MDALADTRWALGSLAALIASFLPGYRWARKGGRSLIFGLTALLGSFMPDPIYERTLETVSESREEREEDEDSGEPK